jgi:hypothetical protein
MRLSLVMLSGLFWILFSGTSFAQQTIYSPEEFEGQKANLINKRVTIIAKYRWAVSGEVPPYIKLLNNDQKYFFLTNSNAGRLVAKDRDQNGDKLDKKCNVSLSGKVVYNRTRYPTFPKGAIFILTSITRLPKDLELFKQRMDRSLTNEPQDFVALYIIAKAARSWAKRYSVKELGAFADSCDKKGLELRGKLIKKEDYKARIQWAKQYVIKLKDTESAIDILNDVFHSKTEKAIADQLLPLFAGWGAYYFRKKWVSYEQLKGQQGFVKRDGQWVIRAKAEFLDVTKVNLSKTSNVFFPADFDLQSRASSGEAVVGQRPNMIVNMASGAGRLGFPTYVDRIETTVKSEKRIYVQWVYPGQQRFYFLNDRLFLWYRGSPPLPKK